MARGTKPINRPLAFWDASALVPLCVHQSITNQAIALYKVYRAVVWWGTAVEIASALARMVRMKQLSADDWVKSRRLAVALAEEWLVIQPSDALRARATQLVDRYDLRAGDSLQLAAALEWSGNGSHGRVFLTGDRKLREAAILSAFDGKNL